MLIREVRIEDAPSLIKCIDEISREGMYFLKDKYSVDEDEERARIENHIRRGDVFLVAEENGVVVGFVIIRRGKYSKNRHVGYLGIGVRKDYRGKGIGKSLMREAERIARQRGFEKICLEVFSSNRRAIKFYKKLGYKIEGKRKKQYIIGGKYVDEVLMGKWLKN